MAALLTVVLIGFVVWNSIMKLRVIGLLASRAVECGTVRGYWSDYFEHCLEGEFSRWVGLGVAVPVFIVLFVAVPPIARWRERGCRIAFERLLQDLRAGKPPAVAMQAAQTLLNRPPQ